MLSGTKGTCFLTPVPDSGTGLLIGGILAGREMKAMSCRNLFKTLNGGTLARGRAVLQVRCGFQHAWIAVRPTSSRLACASLRGKIALSVCRPFVSRHTEV